MLTTLLRCGALAGPLPSLPRRSRQCIAAAAIALAPRRRSALVTTAASGGGESGFDSGGERAGGERTGSRHTTITLAAASLEPELAPEVWTQYSQQLQGRLRAPGGPPFLLPLLMTPICELPTQTLALPVHEDVYMRMFGLVEGSASRLFGAVLASPADHTMESVGSLCELTHLIHVPGLPRRLVVVAARVVGRFQAEQVLCSEPFVTVLAKEYSDGPPADEFEALQLAAQEARVWKEVVAVARLGDALLERLTGQMAKHLEAMDENEELLRWSPSRAARDSVPSAATADVAALEEVQAAGLLGNPDTLGERTREHVCQDALRPVSEDGRRERFSFALASTLGLGSSQQQQLMYSQSTSERLHAAEQVLLEWRSHLAACAALHNTVPPEE